ncbi:MAG: hypothetical protein M3Y22_02485 [Pseudomonadota bacterium]|jgi:hypothetical protein|nr:hypothetical protein [Pseudomonadota bacterium]
MAGVIGATGGKFALVGVALVLHGRIDGNDVRMAIMPGSPASAITPDLADRVRARSNRPDVAIHLRAESFRARISAVEASPAGDAQVRIGQDILADNAIEFDFVHHQALPLSASEARSLERRSRPISVDRDPGGIFSVTLEQDGKAPVHAQLDLALAAGVVTPVPAIGTTIKVGGVDLPKVDVTEGAQPVVGLYAFKHLRVIFDFGHDRIWVRQ